LKFALFFVRLLLYFFVALYALTAKKKGIRIKFLKRPQTVCWVKVREGKKK